MFVFDVNELLYHFLCGNNPVEGFFSSHLYVFCSVVALAKIVRNHAATFDCIRSIIDDTTTLTAKIKAALFQITGIKLFFLFSKS